MNPSLQPSSRPGQMTAVMRAVRVAAGPKVLRAALVHHGKVVDERVIARGAPITVGPSERSTFVIADARIKASTPVIEWSGEGYVLRVTAAMSGRVALATGTVDLETLRPARESEAARSLDLDEGARGKVRLGDAMLLFHFVDPPPVAPRPHLPLAVQRGLADDLDWKTTFIAAFSFLFHFGAVGSLYSDWSDPVVDDDVVVQQFIESLKTLPAAIPVEDKTTADDTSKAPVKVADVGPSKDHGGAKPSPAPGGGPGAPGASPGHVSDTRAHQISAELAAMEGVMVLGLNGPGNAVDGVLRNGNVPVAMIDGVAASAGGSRAGEGDLHMGGGAGGGVIHPGWHSGEGGFPGNVASQGPASAGSAAPVHKPIGTGIISPPSVGGGQLPDAAGVVAAMRGGLRACYNRGINNEDPTMRGAVTVLAKVGPNGEVLSASASGVSGNLSGSVVGCLVGRVRGAQFSPPIGGGATLSIPMKFESQ
jgi:hypothetical protein